MIVISNGQRDELVRLIEWACSKADRRDLRGYNMCRRAARNAKLKKSIIATLNA